jgi:hypothetical protein
MISRVFFDTVIEGLRFQCLLSADGPYIYCVNQRQGVALGNCTSIVNVDTSGSEANGGEWHIAKYRNELRIDISRLSKLGRDTLARELGIPFFEFSSMEESENQFYESEAFSSLCLWAESHPTLFKQYRRCNSYLPGWGDVVSLQTLRLREA